MSEISLKLWRLEKTTQATRGVLIIAPTVRPLITLEEPWKNNLPNISCIPEGKYDLDWTFSPHLQTMTYEVKNVKGRKGIRIHTGNTTKDIEGCILLGCIWGNLSGFPAVLRSREAVSFFENYCCVYDKISLEIVSDGH